LQLVQSKKSIRVCNIGAAACWEFAIGVCQQCDVQFSRNKVNQYMEM